MNLNNILPFKVFLINHEIFKGLLKLDTIIYCNNILLTFEIHIFKSNLTNLIIETFQAGVENREFLKALPIEKIFETQLTLQQAEALFQYLMNIYQKNINNNKLIQIGFKNIKLFLSITQIFSILVFIQGFIQNYVTLKTHIALLNEQENQKNELKNIKTNILESSQIIKNENIESNIELDETVSKIIIKDELIDENDTLFLNDVIKLSPNNIITYFIYKQIYDIVYTKKIDICTKIIDQSQNININIQPLVNFEYLQLTETGIINFTNLLTTFNFTQDEYFSKIKNLIKGLYYLIEKYNDINNFNISIKCIQFLIFIYTLKYDEKQIIGIINYSQKISNVFISYITNNVIKNIVNSVPEFRGKNFINFIHSKKYDVKEIDNLKNIEQLIAKESYMINIDKYLFIQHIINDFTKNKSENENKNKYKLILNSGYILNINELINKENITNRYLNYKIIKSKEKQFEQNIIITDEYYKILKISVSFSLFQDVLKVGSESDLIISKLYTSIENILKQISSIDNTSFLSSTLNILFNIIKPNLNQSNNINIHTELFILYRICIPFIYDIFKISLFKDYFY